MDPRIEWVREWPGQVVICASQIYWTAEVHEAIKHGPQGIKEYHEKLQNQVGVLFLHTFLAHADCAFK